MVEGGDVVLGVGDVETVGGVGGSIGVLVYARCVEERSDYLECVLRCD